MPPDAGEGREVALAVAGAVLVAPEVERHGRHRLGEHELPHLVDERTAVLAPGLDLRAERAGLQLAPVDGERRDAADEGGADVGAAGGGVEPEVLAELLPHPVEALGRQRRAGRADAVEPGQVAPHARLHTLLPARGEVAGTRTEGGDAGGVGEIPERAEAGVGRVPVEEHDRGIRQQAADEEVPHHPAGRREPEQPVAGVGVEVEPELLQVLEQDAALSVHDRLRQSRRARAVEHPERMVEGELGELELAGRQLPVAAGQVREHERALERRQLPLQLRHRLAAVEVLAAVAVAVDGEEHLGLDLGEAVDDAAHAELRRAARPRRADARAAEEGGDRLGDVREVGGDAIPGLDARLAQRRRDRTRARPQLAPRPLAERAQLRRVADGDLGVVAAAEDVLRVAEPRSREPLRARHLAPAEDALVRLARLHLEELPDRAPEGVELVHRPLPEVVVVLEPQTACLVQPLAVARDRGGRDPFGARRPDDLRLHMRSIVLACAIRSPTWPTRR